ncbi:MAG: hypothetical protein ACR2M4_01235 [Actinomycetota bacterium]
MINKRGNNGARGLGLNNDGLPPIRDYADPAVDLAAAGYLYLARGVALLQASLCMKPPCIYAPENLSPACARQRWFRYLEGLITMHGAALAAVLIGVSVWLAPSHKKVVT